MAGREPPNVPECYYRCDLGQYLPSCRGKLRHDAWVCFGDPVCVREWKRKGERESERENERESVRIYMSIHVWQYINDAWVFAGDPVCACVRVRVCACVYLYIHVCVWRCEFASMGWLRWVSSLKLQASFAKEPYKRDDILQKRPIVLRSLLIEATPYTGLSMQASSQSTRSRFCSNSSRMASPSSKIPGTCSICSLLSHP